MKLPNRSREYVHDTFQKRKTTAYGGEIGYTNLKNVANKEKVMPNSFISKDGFGITNPCKKYILNLIKGEDYPPFQNGVPDYAQLELKTIKKKLKNFKV